jgi:hypothetical protein
MVYSVLDILELCGIMRRKKTQPFKVVLSCR